MEILKIKDLVLKIMNAAIEKTVCTKHDVFVAFSAHVMQLNIDIHKDGYESRSKRAVDPIRKSIYLAPPFDGYKPQVPIVEELEEILNYINAL